MPSEAISARNRPESLDAADKSFPYNAANTAYFAVRELRPVENLTLRHFSGRERDRPATEYHRKLTLLS